MVALVLVLGLAVPARADLTISELDVFLNDHEVTVHIVALGSVPPSFYEGIQSGLPSHVRFTVELWQYSRYWRDRLITSKVVERHLTYNVVSKEYKVTFLHGDTRDVYTTRDLRDAQRVLAEVRSVKLVSASSLDPNDVIYVRVRAEAALSGENTFVTRMAGTAEQTARQSDYRTIMRIQ
ncbi:MAG: DUF4390 domain-containing protein [Candidatus Rokubacteria bacterium]|nr:DUF4390 domain-containing protein [Candidatus Rokubacteria bacterium]MBI3826791.1 DUF4390 domain-containing protein [Candidatus Rokubacteria bacterium]